MITFKIEKDGEKWHAYCIELPGCHTFGSTKEEAMRNLKNAMILYIEDEIEQQGFLELIESKEYFTHA